MNRPKPLDYNDNSLMLYVTDLEMYCNAIELENKNLCERDNGLKKEYVTYKELCEKYERALDRYYFDKKRLCEEIERLKEALDKACEELESLDYKNEMHKNPLAYTCDYKEAKQWKEWALKDD